MRFTKFGHSCILVEEKDARILIDPGNYSEGETELADIDCVLVTHEHQDHCDIPSLKAILAKNPAAKVFTNPGVGAVLAGADIPHAVLPAGERAEAGGVMIEAFGAKHAVIYHAVPVVDNVGFMISGRFFYPGDAFTIPPKKVEILGLPIAAPWTKLSEVIDYAREISPKTAIAMHDAMLKSPALFMKWLTSTLPDIDFVNPQHGKTVEF